MNRQPNTSARLGELGPALGRARLVILDCDGVIFDSNHFKSDAFAKALADYPEDAVQELVEYHKAHGGISRFVKFRRFFQTLPTQKTLTVETLNTLVSGACQRFGQICRQAYEDSQPIGEAIEFAKMFGPDRIAVVSGGAQDELRDVFELHGIDDLFRCVLGSPTKKVEHITDLLEGLQLRPDEVVFIGDGFGDYDACQHTGVPFVYLQQYSEWQAATSQLYVGDELRPNVFWCDTWTRLLAVARSEVKPGPHQAE